MAQWIVRLTLLALALLISACGGAPFARADLESVMLVEGDLPQTWAPLQRFNTMVGDPDMRYFAVGQELRGGDARAEVRVGVYHAPDAATRALVWLLGTNNIGAVEAALLGDAGFVGHGVIVFQRGQCLALLSLDDPVEERFALLEHYGRRLDGRLSTLGCTS